MTIFFFTDKSYLSSSHFTSSQRFLFSLLLEQNEKKKIFFRSEIPRSEILRSCSDNFLSYSARM
ncbi:hypothetical protein RNJ44_02235 [Nakaseomyces bracarensis]|uniref:Uncharacterized protein n=1 Tax=Nakaseomyces bracarensis TaxID=273131 RepID=A0ABR4NMV4_9SACH